MQKVYKLVPAPTPKEKRHGRCKVHWLMPVGSKWNGWVDIYAEGKAKPKRRKGTDFILHPPTD